MGDTAKLVDVVGNIANCSHMVGDTAKKDLSPLLPMRHPQRDFFVCDIFDASPKSDMASMEHPLFTLSTKPDMTPRRYEHNGNWLELNPSYLGLATVFDRDVLIYCISQCMAALNEGRQISRTLRMSAHDLLVATNRTTSDKGYTGLKNALERLRNTSLQTNITSDGKEILRGFGFIESYEIVRETRDGRMQALEITLSDWIFQAIDAKNGKILTLSPQYFHLRKPLERRLYEIARKSCGSKNDVWRYKLDTLQKKTGSLSTAKEFRRMVKAIVEANQESRHIPDYSFELEDDVLVIRPSSDFTRIYREPEVIETIDRIRIDAKGYETARKFAEGWDMHHLENQWRAMLAKRASLPKNANGSFIGFVKSYVRRHGKAK